MPLLKAARKIKAEQKAERKAKAERETPRAVSQLPPAPELPAQPEPFPAPSAQPELYPAALAAPEEQPVEAVEAAPPAPLEAQPLEVQPELLPLEALPQPQAEAQPPAGFEAQPLEVQPIEAQPRAQIPPEAPQVEAEVKVQPPEAPPAPEVQLLEAQPPAEALPAPEAQPVEGAAPEAKPPALEEGGVRVVAVRQASSTEPRVVAVRPAQAAEARPAAPHRFRIPRLRLRSASRLEGAELPLPPLKGEVVRVSSGYLVLGDGVVRVYAEREGPWGPLQPLVDYKETQEIFVAEQDGIVHITAGIAGKRYVVELPRELVVERLAQRIAIAAGIPLSERNPQDSGEYHGWRVNLAIPQIAGGWQISAARVVKVEPLRREPLLLARLVALAAAPNSLVFVGPPGSGKTTALIGVLSAVLELWPQLRVSIVEEEPEVAVQVSGPSVVRYFSFGDRNVTANIRATRRYDRPDLLVVGELRGEEVPSWFEAAGTGIPVLTTAHSVGLADAIKRLDTLIQAAGLKASVLDAVRVWVVCGKTVSSAGIERGVKGVYVVTEKGFQPVYKAGRHLPEDEFVKLLPPELQLALDGREAGKVYARIKERLGAKKAQFEPMEPLPFEEVLGGEVG
jgi:pilus assembly protein CpaF